MTAEFKKPEAIIFDWDDTLVVNWQSIHGALNAALTAMGHKIWSMEKARANIRRSLRESFPKMFGDQWEEASDIFYSHIEKNHLSALNKRGDLLRAECNYLGWDNYFTNVIGANDAVRDKPAADPLLLCLKGTSIKPSLTSTWYVGDAPTDLECAINAGVTGVLIKDSDLTPDYQEFPPLMHFRNLNKMADFLA
jgi:phosphoglycolate phosphatase